MQSLDDEREGAGPGEAEGEADGVAEGGVGAARAVGDAEGVGTEDGGDGAAVGAGRLGGDAGLVVLQADAEEGLAVALLQPGASGATPPAAVAIIEQPLLVDKLLQLQLEHPGAVNLPRTAAVSPRSDPCERGSSRCPSPLPPAGPVGGRRAALTWQRHSSAERKASVSRKRPPMAEGQRSRSCPCVFVEGKEECLSGRGERTEGPQPPRRDGGGTVPSPAFRRVSDCYIPLPTPLGAAWRWLTALSDGKRKRKKEGGGGEKKIKKKKKKVLRLIC